MKKNIIFYLSVLFLLSSSLSFAGQKIYDDYGNTSLQLSNNIMDGEQPFKIAKDFSKAGNPWTGVGPWGGNVTSIAISPDNSNTMYAAAGYPYISTDGGNSWNVWETLAVYSTSISIIKAVSDSVIYSSGSISEGLFKSEDNGKTWSHVDNFPITSRKISTIITNPDNPDILYIGMDYNANATDSEQIAKSTDGGINWQILSTSILDASYGVSDISISLLNPQQVIATAKGVITGGDIIYSDDGGSTWQNISQGLPTSYPFNDVEIVGNTVYMSGGMLLASQYVGVYKSTLGNFIWENISNNFPLPVVTGLVVNPDDTLKIFAATDGDGVYLSHNGGDNWVYTTAGADNFSVTDIIFNPNNLEELFIGCSSMAVYKTNDSGLSWTSANTGIATLWVTDVAVDPNNTNNVIASFMADNSGGCYMSNDQGATWYIVDNLPATRYSAVTFDINGNIYACSQGPSTVAQEGVYKSTDGGATWNNTGPNIGSLFETEIKDIDASVSDPNILFISGIHYGAGGKAGCIYRTVDGAISDWDEVYVGPDDRDVRKIEIAQNSNNQILYAGYYSYGITGSFLKSINQGKTWTEMTNGVPTNSYECYALSINPQDPNIVYAGCGYGQSNYIVKTVDGGKNWSTILNANSRVNCMITHPVQDSIIYAGIRNNGILLTEDGGATWENANDGFAYGLGISCFSNCFSVGNSWKIFAGTTNSSAYLTTLVSYVAVDPETTTNITTLHQNYPNPFSNNTKIKFGLAKRGKVTLSVYNLKGQLIDVLVDCDPGPAQSYEVVWPAHVPSKQYQNGVYFYKLETDDYTHINKMIYLK